MVKPAPSPSGLSRLRRPPPLAPLSSARFKGVRLRSWGRWVSEIRIPHSREKIWLGSFTSAEHAAHAYDIASLLLRGSSASASLNFPDSASLLTFNTEFRALVARGTTSPHTVQETVALYSARLECAASSDMITEEDAQQTRVDGNVQGIIKETSVTDSLDYGYLVCSDSAAPTVGSCAPDSCWVKDVLSLILSPTLEKAPSSSSTVLLQGTSPRRYNGSSASTSPTSLVCGSSSAAMANGCCWKATSPEYLIQTLVDDFQYPLEGLARDGFTAISAAVTTRKRFDTETMGPACEVDGTELWSHVC